MASLEGSPEGIAGVRDLVPPALKAAIASLPLIGGREFGGEHTRNRRLEGGEWEATGGRE